MEKRIDMEEHKRELENELFTSVPILNSTLEKLDEVAKIAGKERTEFLNNLICSFHKHIEHHIIKEKKEEKKLKEVN